MEGLVGIRSYINIASKLMYVSRIKTKLMFITNATQFSDTSVEIQL